MLMKTFVLLAFLHLTYANPPNLCLPLNELTNQQVPGPEVTQGRPGKAGAVGRPGAKGDAGTIGPPGVCNCDDSRVVQNLVEQVRMLKKTVQRLMESQRNSAPVRECRVPSTPQFSTVSPRNVRSVRVRGTLTYTCNDGYQIRGRTTNRLVSTCQNDLTWSIEAPVCQRQSGQNCQAGLKDGSIRDNQITAKGSNSASWAPHFARLDRELPNTSGGTWLPKRPYANSWIQVDFLRPTRLVGIVTQGHSGSTWWVTGFKISYGNSQGSLQVIQEGTGGDKVFLANPKNGAAHVTNRFPAPLTGRYFRLILVSYNADSPTLRMEYLRC